MTKLNKIQFLADHEDRGIDSFLCDMIGGISVPACFVDQVQKIVRDEYDVNLVEVSRRQAQSGCFCRVEYKGEQPVVLKDAEYLTPSESDMIMEREGWTKLEQFGCFYKVEGDTVLTVAIMASGQADRDEDGLCVVEVEEAEEGFSAAICAATGKQAEEFSYAVV